MFRVFVVFACIGYIGWLVFEKYNNDKNRKAIKHIIHVNGTRGKSTTTRLICGGLKAGGLKVYCKTTGTKPMTIDIDNNENLIVRRGRSNIKEQIQILKNAANQGADVLVIECMAVNPVMQYISQNKILKADITVITNVRLDHLDEMGTTLPEIADAFVNTFPYNGTVFTAERDFIDYYTKVSKEMGSKAVFADSHGEDYGFDFAENVKLALKVCESLDINKETALLGMKKFYIRDPFALSLYNIPQHNLLFINGLSINDPFSTIKVYNILEEKGIVDDKGLVLLINNRGDRAYRMKQQVEVVIKLKPERVIITGAFKEVMEKLIHKDLPNVKIDMLNIIEDFREEKYSNKIIYAVGNLGGIGEELINYVKKRGEELEQ